MSEESLEASEADVAEQETDAVPTSGDSAEDLKDVPLEADPADAAEQAREVRTDDNEDYR
ncbi:MAG TPA: hypothetical protein VMV07_23605 [Streptosporangiaceae bacterium]|nr:hypothetical protein [Streptosporangiaceae bacterium]